MSTGISFLFQTQKSKFVIGNIHTNVSVQQHSGDFQFTPDRLQDAVLCVKLLLKWNRGKILQSVLVQNSDTLKDMYCDVCAVY